MQEAYLACALWSSLDDDGTPLDALDAQLSTQALDRTNIDCGAFKERAQAAIRASGLDDAQIGHDFWLTRNGHGTGFWDRGLGAVGEELTRLAKAFGECSAYVTDSGEIDFL